MYCYKCGKEITDNATFCSYCGASQAAGSAPKEEQAEQVIMKGLCNRVKNKINVENGKGILTNKRFIYTKHSLGKIMVMGLAVNLTEGTFDFDIPLDNIESIEDGRHGVSKTIIINTKDGERYNFCFTKREEWKIHFQNYVKKAKI